MNSDFPYCKNLVTIGKCIKPHGLKGEIRVKAITDFPERFEETTHVFAHANKDPVRPLTITATRPQSGGYLITFQGVDNIEKAEKLRGLFLAVREDELVELEDDEYWHWELVGLRAESPEGHHLGTLSEVIESPAHDLYVISAPGQVDHLVPAVHQYVPEIDIEAKKIVVILPMLEAD